MTNRNDEMSPELKALSNWQPPEPITVVPPDFDAIIGDIQVQPWLRSYAHTRAVLHANHLRGDPVSCATAIGRLARLWAPQDTRQLPALIAAALADRPGVTSRCRDWARSLDAVQLGYILRCALNDTDRLYETLSHVRDIKNGLIQVEDGALALETYFLAEMRDDQESLLWALRVAEADDADLLEGSLTAFDEEAERHRALIEALPWPDRELLRAIACGEVTAWWGYIEGDRHIWGMDDLMRDEEA